MSESNKARLVLTTNIAKGVIGNVKVDTDYIRFEKQPSLMIKVSK